MSLWFFPLKVQDQIAEIERQIHPTRNMVFYTIPSPFGAESDTRCKKCNHYCTFNNECEVLKGETSPQGWCALFFPKPPISEMSEELFG